MAKKKKVTFDEKNLEENRRYLDKANFKPIVEEKTPYYAKNSPNYGDSASDMNINEHEDIESEIKENKVKEPKSKDDL